MPAMARIAAAYPDIKVEVMIDVGLTNIVAAQYDAGIRPGELVAKDMIAVRVGPDLRMAVVGSPSYFASRKKPRAPQDLTQHNCVNLHLPTHGGSLYAWEFERTGARSTCAWTAKWSSTVQVLCCRPRYRVSASSISLKAKSGPTWQAANSSEYWLTGARCFPAIICIIPAAGNRRLRSWCWSMRSEYRGRA